jgi:hypothetical protein
MKNHAYVSPRDLCEAENSSSIFMAGFRILAQKGGFDKAAGNSRMG